MRLIFLCLLAITFTLASFAETQEDQIMKSIKLIETMVNSKTPKGFFSIVDDISINELETYRKNFSSVISEDDYSKLDSINQFFYFVVKRAYSRDSLNLIKKESFVDALVKANVFNLKSLFPFDQSQTKIKILGKEATVSIGNNGRLMFFVYSQKQNKWLFNIQGEFRMYFFSLNGKTYKERKEELEKAFEVKLTEILG